MLRYKLCFWIWALSAGYCLESKAATEGPCESMLAYPRLFDLKAQLIDLESAVLKNNRQIRIFSEELFVDLSIITDQKNPLALKRFSLHGALFNLRKSSNEGLVFRLEQKLMKVIIAESHLELGPQFSLFKDMRHSLTDSVLREYVINNSLTELGFTTQWLDVLTLNLPLDSVLSETEFNIALEFIDSDDTTLHSNALDLADRLLEKKHLSSKQYNTLLKKAFETYDHDFIFILNDHSDKDYANKASINFLNEVYAADDPQLDKGMISSILQSLGYEEHTSSTIKQISPRNNIETNLEAISELGDLGLLSESQREDFAIAFLDLINKTPELEYLELIDLSAPDIRDVFTGPLHDQLSKVLIAKLNDSALYMSYIYEYYTSTLDPKLTEALYELFKTTKNKEVKVEIFSSMAFASFNKEERSTVFKYMIGALKNADKNTQDIVWTKLSESWNLDDLKQEEYKALKNLHNSGTETSELQQKLKKFLGE